MATPQQHHSILAIIRMAEGYRVADMKRRRHYPKGTVDDLYEPRRFQHGWGPPSLPGYWGVPIWGDYPKTMWVSEN